MGFDILDTDLVRVPDPPETTEEAYAAIVNGVLNHGCKTVTALSLDGQAKGNTGIYETAVTEAGYHPDEDHKFIPGKPTPKDYCSESFIDIGLIGEEEIVEAQHPKMEGGTTYRLSDFGRDMQPIFAYVVREVVESDELGCLDNILGRTESTGDERTPLRRSKILYSINEGSMNESEISEDQNISVDSVNSILERFEEENVLDLVHPRKDGGGFYNMSKNHSRQNISERNDNYAPQAYQIIEFLDNKGKINLEEAAEITGEYETANSVLNRLTKRGFLEEVPNFSLNRKAEEAIEILDDVVNALDPYTSHDTDCLEDALTVMPSYISETWEQYREDTEEFRNQYNKDIWNKSRLNSSKVNMIDPEMAHKRVENLIEDLENPTVNEVKEEWEERFPEKRSLKAIGKYIRECENTQPIEPKIGGIEKQEWEKS